MLILYVFAQRPCAKALSAKAMCLPSGEKAGQLPSLLICKTSWVRILKIQIAVGGNHRRFCFPFGDHSTVYASPSFTRWTFGRNLFNSCFGMRYIPVAGAGPVRSCVKTISPFCEMSRPPNKTKLLTCKNPALLENQPLYQKGRCRYQTLVDSCEVVVTTRFPFVCTASASGKRSSLKIW